MTKLAIHGGKPALSEPLEPYDSISANGVGAEFTNAENIFFQHRPLSGYLGGERTGGYWVEKLEAEWCEAFGVKLAVACNSATSGLLMACVAAGIRRGDNVITTPYTMSATAAAPKFLGADLTFCDIKLDDYCLDPGWVLDAINPNTRAIIATNLFGHPARLTQLHTNRVVLIEDNAQAPFAIEHGRYTGTVGNIGVFSLNVHKHFHTGEGGVCVTNSAELAHAMRMFRNHGEMAGMHQVGLNLRMTEVTAAIACAQLARGKELVSQRVEIAEAIIDQVKDLPGIWVPTVRENCRHVYYCLPFYIEVGHRDWFVEAMAAEGVPLQRGYVKPLYHMGAFRDYFMRCKNAELAHKNVTLYENCAWTPTSEQIKQLGEAFKKVADYAQTKTVEETEVSEG